MSSVQVVVKKRKREQDSSISRVEEAGGGGGCGKRRRARLRETRRATLNSDTGEAESENAFGTPLSPA